MKEIVKNHDIKKNMRSVFVALFAAIISVGGFIAIPIPASPLPVVIQNMLVVLTGALLGGAQGGAAVGLVFCAGALGLPVFSGGRGGMAHILGPTGGFIFGYFFAALITGFYIGKPSTKQKTQTYKIFLGCFLGYTVIYLFGLSRLQNLTGLPLIQVLIIGFVPYAIADAVKLTLTVFLAVMLRPTVARYLFDE